MTIIKKLKYLKNTIIIVEHNPTMILAADKVIDIGGGAGKYGGYIMAQGTPNEIKQNEKSEIGKYLSSTKTLMIDKEIMISNQTSWIKISGISGNNLKEIDITIPKKALTCVTGVSGSGKSTLIKNGIYPAILSCVHHTIGNKMFKEITGADDIQKVIYITQAPIGRSVRSTPATYTGIMDEIRILFSKTALAKKQKYSISKFSYNSKEGQCLSCHGYGYKVLDTPYMPYTKTVCPICHGKKFNHEVLKITYKDKNISEVLDLSIIDALDFSREHRKISAILQVFVDVGLGYLTLGQDSSSLSGGEAQRVKLANELSFETMQNTVYLLDEPTTGLSFSDIQNLLNVIGKIIDKGNTVILIEHNLSVIKNADWIIDLGPGGGIYGGKVMVQGVLDKVIKCKDSHTGNLLKKEMF